MAIFQSLVLEVEDADECFHHIGVHLSRNILIPFIIVVVSKHIDASITILLLLLLLVVIGSFNNGRRLTSLLGSEAIEEEGFSDCGLVKIGVADEIGSRDMHFSLLGCGLFEEDLDGG